MGRITQLFFLSLLFIIGALMTGCSNQGGSAPQAGPTTSDINSQIQKVQNDPSMSAIAKQMTIASLKKSMGQGGSGSAVAAPATAGQ